MSAPAIEVAEQTEPGLAIVLKATPPETGQMFGGRPEREDWTLDLLEKTAFEFRAAGAWDESKVSFGGYPSAVSCEVLASRGPEAMPWGWKPSDGKPKPPELLYIPESRGRWQDQEIQHAIPAFLGSRVLHGLLLFALLTLAIVEAAR